MTADHVPGRPACGICAHKPRAVGSPPPAPGTLTARELGVVTEVARGGTHRQIGVRLGISEYTVSDTIVRARKRLGAVSPAHLVARAIGLGILPADVAGTQVTR